jgi:endogenous inhibitor of DNA gyrase (YacG/DUF329 family)
MASTLSCPTCARPIAVEPESRPAAFPFCSERCRLRDFGRWMDGSHAIPGKELSFDPYAAEDDLAGSEGARR